MKIDKTPLVSVCMITYNHEAYICEAIEGVLLQKTTFPIELIIGEDCSSDGTRTIVKDYEVNYPNIIVAQYPEKNRGMMNNFITVMQSARGKYIAICEGDDYWTDPYKLQKQVDFLEANPEFSFSFHDTVIYNQNSENEILRIGNRQIDEVVDIKSVIIQNNIATASLVFRNNMDWTNLPDWFSKISKGDYGLVVLLAEKGLGKYLPDVMSVYRVHDGGVWSGNKTIAYHNKEDIKFYNYLEEYFEDAGIKKTIAEKRAYSCFNLGIALLRDLSFIKGAYYVARYNGFFRDEKLKSPPRKILSAFKSGLKAKLKMN